MAEPYFGLDRNGQKVTGAREDAVLKASRIQIEADRDAMNATGIIDFEGGKDRVRRAIWDALDQYDAEQAVKVGGKIIEGKVNA